jgi:hypothetical protein
MELRATTAKWFQPFFLFPHLCLSVFICGSKGFLHARNRGEIPEQDGAQLERANVAADE